MFVLAFLAFSQGFLISALGTFGINLDNSLLYGVRVGAVLCIAGCFAASLVVVTTKNAPRYCQKGHLGGTSSLVKNHPCFSFSPHVAVFALYKPVSICLF